MNKVQLSLDPDQLLDRVDSLFDKARARLRHEQPLELYHRASVSLRVGRRADGRTNAVRLGSEHGLAIRLRDRTNRTQFASTTGLDEGSLNRVIEGARMGYGVLEPDAVTWAPSGTGLSVDRDPTGRAPTVEQLVQWMDRAWEATATRVTLDQGWLEVAETVESWAAEGGMRASRSRTRAWAVAQAPEAPPLFVASRRWEDLSPDGWHTVAADRSWPDRPVTGPPQGPVPVLLGPEASAMLVLALIRALSSPGHARGQPVGPGWNVVDDPLREDAVLGGTFDDGVFPTQRRTLADGRRVVGTVDGPGTLRRPSFRDRPTPLPAFLLVDAPDVPLPTRAVLGATLTLHAASSRSWILELRGGLLDSGEPGPAIEGHIRVAPEDLVRRCVGAVGASRRHYRDVLTPALLFDGLRLE